MFRSLILAALLPAISAAQVTQFQLPTENEHLFTGEPEKFYMYVDRNFEGVASKPWEGGSFGLVRNPIRVGGNVEYLQIHEGIDIAPIKRDKAGNPLDLVMSIADGTVVHLSDSPGRSNYGRYIVVAHPIDASGNVVHSLYAHLARASVKPGDTVKRGSVLGQMGYTGAGINRTRAHVHLELGLLMSPRFDGWIRSYGGGTNHHGNYNGMNLIGMDVARFLTEQRANPQLSVTEFVRKSPAYFKVTIPRNGSLDFANLHPWLVYGELSRPGPSWEISFTDTGLPTGITVSQRKVSTPIVSAVRDAKTPHRYLTRGLLSGEGKTATLSSSGKKLVALIAGSFPDPR
ncbi:M23 family metallopeptidase [Haloferula chungangensis]|uniref:M23 family metallopeptidase n=1 Tax=Haloferula chungangensis TaxID=1048331 RepID=A0ABW2LBW1_9BACT